MPNCSRCDTLIDGGWAYCGACGKPRITESLRIPVVQPDWQKRVLQVLIGVAAFWLLITVGVAFLREAKAVRDSRELLALENPQATQNAWSLLSPFLVDHPRHLQARFLCGKAAIRLGLRDEATQCLAVVGEQSPELAEELGKDYRQVLTLQTRTQVCDDGSNFEQLLTWAEGLGPPYAASVYEGLDGVVEACRTSGYGPSQFIAVLAKRDQALKMVEKGYVPAIGNALAQARYDDASRLAQQAVYFVPEGKAAVKEAMAASAAQSR